MEKGGGDVNLTENISDVPSNSFIDVSSDGLNIMTIIKRHSSPVHCTVNTKFHF